MIRVAPVFRGCVIVTALLDAGLDCPESVRTVVFRVVANAANDEASEFGGFIYDGMRVTEAVER